MPGITTSTRFELKILVTGFKPFLNETLNPSEILSVRLAEKFTDIQSLILPVEFGKSYEILKGRLENDMPDFLIMIGQASGRQNVCLEKIGLNYIQTQHKDESGFLPKAGRISENSDLALMSQFPIEQAFLFLRKQNLPIEISFSAGTFVCNELYFRVLKDFSELKSLFVHVPLIPEQIKLEEDRPILALETQFRCLQELAEFLFKTAALR